MAIHSLGGVDVLRRVNKSIDKTFALAQSLLDDYKRQGLEVQIKKLEENEKLEANIRNSQGTDIDATVTTKVITETETELRIVLYGDVYVGGFGGFFVTESLVQSEAKKRLNSFLDSML